MVICLSLKVKRDRSACSAESAQIEERRRSHVFATGLHKPFGIAFYPLGLPVPNMYTLRTRIPWCGFAYQSGDLKARGKAQTVVSSLPGGGKLRGGGHWTRDIAFSKDGQKMFVSVGSHSNVDDAPSEDHRADILEFASRWIGRTNLRIWEFEIL